MDKNVKNNYETLIRQGIDSVNNRKFDSAESYFLNAIKLSKRKYQAYINLSNVYILQNKKNK